MGGGTVRFKILPLLNLSLKQIQLNFQDVKIGSAQCVSLNTKPFRDVLDVRDKVFNSLPQVHKTGS
jgi:hypothetical protein